MRAPLSLSLSYLPLTYLMVQSKVVVVVMLTNLCTKQTLVVKVVTLKPIFINTSKGGLFFALVKEWSLYSRHFYFAQ